jgi:hypothetical protein
MKTPTLIALLVIALALVPAAMSVGASVHTPAAEASASAQASHEENGEGAGEGEDDPFETLEHLVPTPPDPTGCRPICVSTRTRTNDGARLQVVAVACCIRARRRGG